jgi:hypothetical protein
MAADGVRGYMTAAGHHNGGRGYWEEVAARKLKNRPAEGVSVTYLYRSSA